MPDSYNFDIFQGDRFSAAVRIKDDAGEAMNLSGYNARAAIRRRYSSSETLGPFSCVFSDAVAGELTVSMTPSGTAALPVTQLVYDIEAYTADDADVFKILKGYVNVNPEVTHDA